MSPEIIGLVALAILFVAIFIGFPIAFTLIAISLGVGWFALGDLAIHLMTLQLFSVMRDPTLAAVPFFLFMGYLLEESGLIQRLFRGVQLLLAGVNGSLYLAVIITATIFAAATGIVGSSVTLLGVMAAPAMMKSGYDVRMSAGAITAGGTLGILIPPSINMIIYAVLTNTSVPKLYLAGIVPGILLALGFMLVVLIACAWRPAWGGQRIAAPLAECIAGLVHLLPPLGLFLVVVGSIYAGIATPTEAAALGVMAGLGLAWWNKALNWHMLRAALLGTMRSTGMIMLIIVAAYFLNFVMSSIGLTTALTDTVQKLGLSKWEMLIAVIVFYVVLGCFMETLSLMITTIPVIAPVMAALGFDMIWFGVVIIVLVETALITPPVGLNLFVVHNLRPSGSMNDVILGAAPFVVALFALLAALAFFPGLALWLPSVISQ